MSTKSEPKESRKLREIKISFFNLSYLIIKHHSDFFFINILSLVLQFIQVIGYSFSPKFTDVWSFSYYQEMSMFISYFQVVPIFRGNKLLYVLFYLLFLGYVLFLLCFLGYCSYQLSKLKLRSKECLYLLDTLFTLNNCFFLPIIKMFMSSFNCTNGKSAYSASMQCYTGIHLLLTILGSLFLVLYSVLSFFIDSTFYEFKNNKDYSSAKMSSATTISFFYAKIILVLIFETIKNKMMLCFISLCVSLYLTYVYNMYQPYHNQFINKLNIALYYMLFWSNFVLLFANLLHKSAYEGGILLILIGYPIIVIGTFYRDHSFFLSQLLIKDNVTKQPYLLLKKIKLFLSLVDHSDIFLHRRDNVILLGFIKYMEQFCTRTNCALRQYIYESENTISMASLSKSGEGGPLENFSTLLYEHGEKMYKNAIAKFPNYINLQISYGLFLYEKLKKKQRGISVLEAIDKSKLNFEEEFLIHRIKKLFEEEMEKELRINGLDYVSALAYKGYMNTFKTNIIKTSLCYTEFWSLLSMNKVSRGDNFERMSTLGSKINRLVGDIKFTYDKIQEINKNEIEATKLYSKFLKEILNDEKLSEEYDKKASEMEDKRHKYDENNIYNLNYKSLSSSEEYKYIIASANPQLFGIITNISFSSCILFGYSKEEVIGKSLTCLMPEIFSESHQDLLHRKLENFKKDSGASKRNKSRTRSKFKSFPVFGKNKSKYLVMTSFRAGIVSTEEGETYFIAQVLKDNTNKSPEDDSSCYILTDKELMIQNFTANCAKLMNLNSSSINTTVEIIDYIKELNDEFMFQMMEVEDPNSIATKKNVKLKIINRKYRTPREITWAPIAESGGDDTQYDFTNLKWKSSRNIDFELSLNGNKGGSKKFQPKIPVRSNSNKKGHSFLPFHSQKSSYKLDLQDVKSQRIQANSQKYLSIPETGSTFGSLTKQKKKDDKFYLTIDDMSIDNNQVGYLFRFEVSSAYNQRKGNFSSFLSLLKRGSRKLDGGVNGKFVEGDFVPVIEPEAKVLSFDINNLAYKPLELGNGKELAKAAKEMAFEKLTTYLKKDSTEDKTEESEYSYSNSNSDSGSSSEESYSSSQKKSLIKPQSFIQGLNQKIKEASNENYYHVNLEKIIYFQFDFKKNCVDKDPNYVKIREPELKMSSFMKTEEKSDEKNVEKKEAEEEAKVKEEKQGEKQKDEFKENAKFIENQENRVLPEYTERDILIDQIKAALHSKKSDQSVVQLLTVSIILLILIIIVTFMIYYLFLHCKSRVLQFLDLILQSVGFHRNLIFSLHSVREILLLSFKPYSNIYSRNREKYISQMEDQVLEYFKKNSNILKSLSSIFDLLGKQDKESVENATINISALDSEQNYRNYTLSFFTALFEDNMALYHFSQTPREDRHSKEKNTFYFIHNSLNDVMKTSEEQNVIFNTRFLEETMKSKTLLVSYCCCVVVIYILIYFVFIHFYDKVELQKQRYLSVFFEIGGHFINESLERCEKFSQRIQLEANEPNGSISHSSFSNESNEEMKVSKTRSRKEESSKSYVVKGNKKFLNLRNKLYLLGGTMLFCFASIGILIYNIYLNFVFDEISNYVYYYKKSNDNYLFLFVTVREMMFDPERTILNTPIVDYVNSALENFYKVTSEQSQLSSKYFNYMPNEYKEFNDYIKTTDICEYSKEFFKDSDLLSAGASEEVQKMLCRKLLYSSLQYGWYSFLVAYLEDIREMKNRFFMLQKEIRESGLGTLDRIYGVEQVEKEKVKDPSKAEEWEKFNPINLFTMRTHTNLVLAFSMIIKEILAMLSEKITTSLDSFCNNCITDMYIIIFILLVIELGVFFFGLIPFEISLRDTIYKAKNMLSIIPKDVLAVFPRIKVMLSIDVCGQIKKRKQGKKFAQK